MCVIRILRTNVMSLKKINYKGRNNFFSYYDPSGRYARHRHASDNRTDSDEEDNIEMMDETVAAMVLTSLSVSPKSPPLSTHFINKGEVLENAFIFMNTKVAFSLI